MKHHAARPSEQTLGNRPPCRTACLVIVVTDQDQRRPTLGERYEPFELTDGAAALHLPVANSLIDHGLYNWDGELEAGLLQGVDRATGVLQ